MKKNVAKKGKISFIKKVKNFITHLYLFFLNIINYQEKIIDYAIKNKDDWRKVNCFFKNKMVQIKIKIDLAIQFGDPYVWNLVILDPALVLKEAIKILRRTNIEGKWSVLLKRKDFRDYLDGLNTVDALLFMKETREISIERYLLKRFDIKKGIVRLRREPAIC